MPKSWSARIANRYHCDLSAQLVDWFDSEIWMEVGQAEFHEPIDPESLLGQAPEKIWPGLMTCDLLPIIGNTVGDWLCVRVDQDNVASEIIHWYHGGGDWIPWGNQISEAIVFDALIDRLPGPLRRHAVPAESPRPLDDQTVRRNPITNWAIKQNEPLVDAAWDPSIDDDELASLLIDGHVAETAVRCELVLSALVQPSGESLKEILQEDPSVDRSDLAQWCFDVDRLPGDVRRKLEQAHELSFDHAQNWDAAEQHAQRVAESTPELAWAWDIVGYAAERRGDLEKAKEAYKKGAACSIFTDQSIRLGTHWSTDHTAKFSVARLSDLCPDLVEQSPYLNMLCNTDANGRRQQTTQYWVDQGSRFHAQGAFDEAYRCFMAAGWDVGAAPIEVYADLIDKIAKAAEGCNQRGRAEVARTHRRCLLDRYGV